MTASLAPGLLRRAFALGLLVLPASACAEWLLDASAGYAYDDNLSNGLADEDPRRTVRLSPACGPASMDSRGRGRA